MSSGLERVTIREIINAKSATASRAALASPENARKTADNDLPDTTTLQQWLEKYDGLSILPIKLIGNKRLTTIGDVASFVDRNPQLRALPFQERRTILGLTSWVYGSPIVQPHIPTICGIHLDDIQIFFKELDYDRYEGPSEIVRKHFKFSKVI